MMNCNPNGQQKHLPYKEPWERYQDALETIQYQQHQIHELNDEIDGWCQSYDNITYELEEYKYRFETHN